MYSDLKNTYYDNIFPNVNIRADYSCIDHCIFSNKNMVTHLKREECNSETLFLQLFCLFFIILLKLIGTDMYSIEQSSITNKSKKKTLSLEICTTVFRKCNPHYLL